MFATTFLNGIILIPADDNFNFKIFLDKLWGELYYCIRTVIQKGEKQMEWELDKSRPICPQICEKLCVMIANGEIKPNERLLSVREVAVNAGVNPNTVQKAFELLEQKGLIYSVRSSGWFVEAEVGAVAKETVDNMVYERTKEYFEGLKKLGKTDAEIKAYIKEWNE